MATGSSANFDASSSPFGGSNALFSRSINELNLDEDSDEDVEENDDPIHRLFGESDSEGEEF